MCQCICVWVHLSERNRTLSPSARTSANKCRAGRTWAVSLCPLARVCSGMVANCSLPESRSWEGIWEDSMPCWSTAHLGSPAGMSSSPSAAQCCGETARREQSAKPTELLFIISPSCRDTPIFSDQVVSHVARLSPRAGSSGGHRQKQSEIIFCANQRGWGFLQPPA